MTANVVAYVFVSALTEQSPLESLQSALFVNAFRPDGARMLDAVQRSATDRDVYRLAQFWNGPSGSSTTIPIAANPANEHWGRWTIP